MLDFVKGITDTGLGENIFRPGGIVFYFLTQVGDIYAHVMRT